MSYRKILIYGKYEFILTKGKPYSVIDPGRELRWGVTEKEQEELMFSPADLLDNSNIYNSGERELSIETNSTYEMEHICSILKERGFKIKGTFPDDRYTDRYFLDPETYNINPSAKYTYDYGDYPGAWPQGSSVVITLRRKDFKKFMKVIEDLREQHNYRSLYFGKNRAAENRVIIK